MKKISLLACFYILSFATVFSQTQAEIDKMMREAKAEIDKLKKDPNNKELLKDIPDIDSLMNNMSKKENQSAIKDAITGNTSGLPEKNNKLLSQLPKKILTNTELSAYLQTLQTQLWQKINSGSADSARLTANQIGNDGEKLCGAAILTWFKNDAEAAVLLAIKAATLSLNDNTSLNNCAAILSMAGLDNKAIPILQVLLQREPNSSTVLNNMGQAYTSLGELDTAMFYFGRCIKIAPTHPEANNTATIICMKKGQTEAAKKYCQQAIEGGLTSEAVKNYKKLLPGNDISEEVDENPFRSYPFNEHDFKFPEQCEKIDDIATIDAELKALATMYRAMNKKLQDYADEKFRISKKMADQFQNNPAGNLELANSETIFTRRAGYAYHKIINPLIDAIRKIEKKQYTETRMLESELDVKKKELNRNQSAEAKACDQNNVCHVKVVAKYCRLTNELSNQYLPRFAVINRDYVKKMWRYHKEMFEALSVYARVAIRPGTFLKEAKEGERSISLMSILVNGRILGDGYELLYHDLICLDKTAEEIKRIEELEIKENYKCNLNISVPLGKGMGMKFSCDEFEIEGGLLIRTKYNKNFRSGQTTLYAGAGIIPGFGVSASQYVYVCFDKNNKPVDGGTQGEIRVFGEKVSLTTSINTGVKFEPGPLKPLTDVLPYLFK